jgi:sugar phosphate isomerase/epimerase
MSLHSSRRGFLATSAASLALARSGFAAKAPEQGAFKIGVATYSLRKFTRERAIQMLHELNVKYVSIKDFHLPLNSTPEQIREARAEFDKNGLVTLSGGVIRFAKDDEGDIRSKFEYAKLAGIPMIICMPDRAILPKLENFVKEYDIKIAVHNHGPQDPNFKTPQSALALLKGMDPRCGVCVDLGHTALTGVDVVESIREAGSRLLDMHIKDLHDVKNSGSWCDVGDGVLPVVGIFKQLNRMGYRGGVMLEYEINEDNPMPGMQKSLAYMRGVAAALRG